MKYDVYDFDGTIYDGDSGVDFVKFGLLKYPKFIFKFPKILFYAFLYLFKVISKEQMKSVIFSFISYIDNLDEFVRLFWEKNEHKLKRFWTEKGNHKRDVIISASCYLWLQPIADKYAIAGLIATDIDTRTGEIIGKNCHGKEKVKLFYENFPKGIVGKMFTDSYNDLPLIEEAKEGIIVKRFRLIPYKNYKPNIIVRFWRWGWGIYHKNEEVWNYLIFGGVGFFASIATYALFRVFCNVLISNILSWILVVLLMYVTNKLFVFKSKCNTKKEVIKEFVSFISARIFTLVTETAILEFAVYIAFNDFIAKVVGQVVTIVLNYILSKLIIFKKKKDK